MENLQEIVKKHQLWLRGGKGGERAIFTRTSFTSITGINVVESLAE